MKNILVSGASGIVGYGILKSLRMDERNSYNLIGTTIYDDSIAPAFCDVFEKAPMTNDPKYIQWLQSVIKKNSVDLLLPGIEADLYKWVDNVSEIEENGAKVVLNNVELINLCKDKWLFFEKLNGMKSRLVIETLLEGEFNYFVGKLGLPFILKPRRGYGSKGIVYVKDKHDFSLHHGNIGSTLIAQRIVGEIDEEYTTSAFCDGEGSYYCSMTLKRKLSQEGFTDKAEVVEIDGIDQAISELCKAFKPIGPTNFQFRRQQGELKLLEINPRISSSTSIRSAFGYNESQMAVEFFLEHKIPSQPQIRSGRAVRYVEDYIFYK